MSTPEGVPKDEIEKKIGATFKVGFGNAKAKKIIDLKEGKIIKVQDKYDDEDQTILIKISKG